MGKDNGLQFLLHCSACSSISPSCRCIVQSSQSSIRFFQRYEGHQDRSDTKTDRFGRIMIDRDGLPLYRSIRGTSNLESIHQYLTTSFGHTMAGPWYSDSLLAILRHFLNWRMSRKNRPNFPNLMHYDGQLSSLLLVSFPLDAVTCQPSNVLMLI